MHFPPRPARFARFFLLLTATFTLVGSACRKSQPLALGPAFTAPDVNRVRVLARVLVPSLDRTFATVDALRTQGALPFGSAELRSMIVARLSVPDEVMDLAHTGKPLGAALVAPAQAGGVPFLAASAELRAPQALARVLGALGAPLAMQKEARQFRRPDGGSFWLAQAGDALVWADSLEALAEAGAHAVEARVLGDAASRADDMVVTAFPGGYARLEGVDLSRGPQELERKLLADYEQSYLRRGRTAPPAEKAATEALTRFVSGPLSDSRFVEMTLGLAEQKGVLVGLNAMPREGSAFATLIAAPSPFTVEVPLAGDTPVSLMAVGPTPSFLRLYQDVLDAQGRAGVPGATAVAARFRALAQQLSGAVTMVGRPSGRTLTLETAVGLKRGANAATAMEALAALAGDPGLPALLTSVYRMETPSVRVGREGDGLRLELGVPGEARPGTPAAFTRAMFGTSTPVLLVKPGRDRLLFAWEPGAADRLQRLLVTTGAQPSPTSPPPLAEALAESRGRDGMAYVDLLGYARVLLGALLGGGQARLGQGLLAMPGLAQLTLPVWLNYRGGKALNAQMRIPRSTLTNAAAAMALFGGMGGAMMPGLPEQQ